MNRTDDHYGQTKATKAEDDLPLFAWAEEEQLPEPPEERPDYQPATQTKLEETAGRLLEYLKTSGAVGKENAILGNELVVRLSLGGTNVLRDAVGLLREDGHFILSAISGGYFMAADVDEVIEFFEMNYLNRMATTAGRMNRMISHASAVFGAPAQKIKYVKIAREDHPDLPPNIHD